MSEEPPADNLPDGYGIEPLPYIPPSQQTSPEMEEDRCAEPPRSVAEENSRPAASVVPSSADAQTQPTHHRKRRTLWIAGSIVGILLLVSVAIVIIDINSSTPDKTLDTFCNALQSGDYRTAYEQFSPKLQGVIAETTFADIFAHDKVTTCTYSAINENGNSATAGLELVHASKGTNKDGITLTKDNKNNWKITDFYRQT
jgi:hypothetical protein